MAPVSQARAPTPPSPAKAGGYRSISLGWALLLALAVVLYLWGLGNPFAPGNGDEMVYIHIARLTAESGHWLPLVSDLGAMRNTKPPLLFWQAMLAGDFGQHWSLLALRLPSIVYTLLTTAAVALLARQLTIAIRPQNHRDTATAHAVNPWHTACLAAVVYLAFFSTFRYGRVYLTSAPETFWLALPMFWLLLRTLQGKVGIPAAHYLWFGLAWGLGCAYKSFALVAPAAATVWCVAMLLQRHWHGSWQWQRALKVSLGLGLAAAIALGIFALWFVLDPDPGAVWREFVLGENAGKLASDRGYWYEALRGGSSIWMQLLAYFENAGLLWFVAMGLAWGLLRKGTGVTLPAPHPSDVTGVPAAGRVLVQVLLVWLLVWLVVFAIPSQRSARYVIPAMPALAIVLALAWGRIHRLWFWLTLLLTVPALVLLPRIAWVLNQTDIGSTPLLAAALLAGAVGLGAVVLGLCRPAFTRTATLVACLCVYACFGAMVAPLNQDSAGFTPTVQAQLSGKRVAVPNGFNAQYERFHFLLPQAQLFPYDTDGRNSGTLYPELPAKERLERLVNEFDAVVWVQTTLDQTHPTCIPHCQVLAQRWHVKSRHQSGEVTLDNVWYPGQWLFRREWLVVRGPL